MDRKIQRLDRVCRFLVVAALACAVGGLVLNRQTFGQDRGRGGFQMPTPEETFNSLDTDSDGRLNAEEISSNRFVGRMLRDTVTSRGLSRDEFIGQMQRIRENFGRGGFGGRGGPGGGPPGGRGRDGDSGRDRGRGDDRGGDDRPGEQPGTPSNSSGDPSATSTPGQGDAAAPATTTATVKPRPRITIDLQADLLPGDTDRDGQVGLYEWRRFSGRSLKEFQQLDQNQDGFVTPREVAFARPTPTGDTSAVATGQPAAPATQPATDTPAADDSTKPAADAQPPDERTARDIERFFKLLDKNSDGQIVPDEWVDGRIRTMFTNDGIDLSQPLTAADFSRHYARLNSSGSN
jgi:Ca2+-binding EF-hand superfamily protein